MRSRRISNIITLFNSSYFPCSSSGDIYAQDNKLRKILNHSYISSLVQIEKFPNALNFNHEIVRKIYLITDPSYT